MAKIVIVTDDPLAEKFFTGKLEKLGYEAVAVNAAKEISDVSDISMILIDLTGKFEPHQEFYSLRALKFQGKIVLFGWSPAGHQRYVKSMTTPEMGGTFVETDHLCQAIASKAFPHI